MKTCLLCGAVEPLTATTCPKCGEATWFVKAEVQPEPEPKKKGRK